MFLVGEVIVTQCVKKEYDGRVYFKCQGMGEDKCAYSFSCAGDVNPQVGDHFQMYIQPSDKDFKAIAFYQKVK